jgi:hypothetical protein
LYIEFSEKIEDRKERDILRITLSIIKGNFYPAMRENYKSFIVSLFGAVDTPIGAKPLSSADGGSVGGHIKPGRRLLERTGEFADN